MVVSDPLYDLPRDLEGQLPPPCPAQKLIPEGYGEESINPQWPNGAKICISFILNYEEGAERTIVNGDNQSEPYLWEKGASSSYLSNARHAAAESEYGKEKVIRHVIVSNVSYCQIKPNARVTLLSLN